MWWKAVGVAWTIGRMLWRNRAALKGLDRHERKRVAGEAAQSARVSAQLIGAHKRFPARRG